MRILLIKQMISLHSFPHPTWSYRDREHPIYFQYSNAILMSGIGSLYSGATSFTTPYGQLKCPD